MNFKALRKYAGNLYWAEHRTIWKVYQFIRHFAAHVNDEVELYRILEMCDQDRGIYLNKLNAYSGLKLDKNKLIQYVSILKDSLLNDNNNNR